MGNPQTFPCQNVVDNEAGTEVVAQQLPVDTDHRRNGQGLAGLGIRVNALFEFGEHRLPNNRGPDPVDLAMDQIGSFLVAAGTIEKIPAEQLLVERAGYLRHEDRVVIILVWL